MQAAGGCEPGTPPSPAADPALRVLLPLEPPSGSPGALPQHCVLLGTLPVTLGGSSTAALLTAHHAQEETGTQERPGLLKGQELLNPHGCYHQTITPSPQGQARPSHSSAEPPTSLCPSQPTDRAPGPWPSLADPAVGHDDDLVGRAHGAEAVGDDQHGAPGAGAVQGLLHGSRTPSPALVTGLVQDQHGLLDDAPEDGQRCFWPPDRVAPGSPWGARGRGEGRA